MNTFKGGLPYGPDVKRLTEAFPPAALTEGRSISHEQLLGTLDCETRHERYYCIVNAWRRKQLHENGVYIIWEQGKGVVVLDPAGVLGDAERKIRQKIQQVGRSVKLLGWVDRGRLDPTGQARLDHQTMVAKT
ncbi:MAG: hypothetical protein ACREMY_12490, partial [bacterium]